MPELTVSMWKADQHCNGVYVMSRRGLKRIREPWTKLLTLAGAVYFIGLACGYAWRVAQTGGLP